MADIADDAYEVEQRNLAASLRLKRQEYRATGLCLYCSEDLGYDKRFCDSDCRNSFDKQMKLREIAGR